MAKIEIEAQIDLILLPESDNAYLTKSKMASRSLNRSLYLLLASYSIKYEEIGISHRRWNESQCTCEMRRDCAEIH